MTTSSTPRPEVLSPRTEKIDRSRKMAIYAREGVGHLWFVDPRQRRLEAYRLVDCQWEPLGAWPDAAGQAPAVPPFEAIALDLPKLWKW
jgi:Uma2 family endonuclease